MKKEDLTGKMFGRLKVIKEDPNRGKRTRWLCQCSCGNPELVSVLSYNLKSGAVKSCGCLVVENNKKRGKHNRYKLSEDGSFYTVYEEDSDKYFYVDAEDYAFIKDYYWFFDETGYVKTIKQKNNTREIIYLHRLIMHLTPEDKVYVDHIIHPKGKEDKIDNRKSNLRIVTPTQNSMNKWISSKNKSGTTGVIKKPGDKWEAFLTMNKETKLRKTFDTIEEAIQARKEAEEKHFGEYRLKPE